MPFAPDKKARSICAEYPALAGDHHAAAPGAL
jgi:hypothetical protein